MAKQYINDGKILTGFDCKMLDIKFEHISAIKVIPQEMKKKP